MLNIETSTNQQTVIDIMKCGRLNHYINHISALNLRVEKCQDPWVDEGTQLTVSLPYQQ